MNNPSDRKWRIYVITNLKNEMQYVGLVKRRLLDRAEFP